MENQEKRSFGDRDHNNEVFSKSVRAGKRTYFFDVKQNRVNDLFVIITESRKMTHDDGSATYQKNRLHVHVEGFDKFMEGLNEAIEYTKANRPPMPERPTKQTEIEDHNNTMDEISKPTSFTDISFDDLGS